MEAINNKILSLIKMANPEDPIAYTNSIVKSFAIEKANEGIKNCNDCGLCDFKQKSISYGNIDASILIINDDISEEQYLRGGALALPLDDTDGDTLNRALTAMSANKEAIYMVNSVNCYPGKNVNGKIVKKIPSVKERTICKQHLDKIINAMKPSVIITLGSIATNSLSTSKVSMLESRGNEFNYNGYSVIPTFHPSFFREMASKFDVETMNMYKDNFLLDLHTAFNIALAKDPNCKIGNIVI